MVSSQLEMFILEKKITGRKVALKLFKHGLTTCSILLIEHYLEEVDKYEPIPKLYRSSK